MTRRAAKWSGGGTESTMSLVREAGARLGRWFLRHPHVRNTLLFLIPTIAAVALIAIVQAFYWSGTDPLGAKTVQELRDMWLFTQFLSIIVAIANIVCVFPFTFPLTFLVRRLVFRKARRAAAWSSVAAIVAGLLVFGIFVAATWFSGDADHGLWEVISYVVLSEAPPMALYGWVVCRIEERACSVQRASGVKAGRIFPQRRKIVALGGQGLRDALSDEVPAGQSRRLPEPATGYCPCRSRSASIRSLMYGGRSAYRGRRSLGRK